LKIVHICLCGPVTDGWNYQDNMLTKYHKKLGYDVTMITSQWIWGTNGKFEKFEKTNYFDENGVKVIRLSLKGKDDFSKKFKKYIGLYKAISEEKPDILFIHNLSFVDIDTIVLYLKKNKNIKVFIDNHSDYSNSATSWISKNILHKIIWKSKAKKIEPYTSKFYGVLPARVDFLVDLYDIPKEKVELLVMGADDERVKETNKPEIRINLRKKYGILDKDFLIVTGGKIDEAKAETLLLMEAVKKINRKNIKLIIFGSVSDALKERFNSLLDEENIQYVGWIDAKYSYDYFKASDLVVFPGRHSVFWEQATGQGIPMVCKYWDGTTHIDCGGNVVFLYNNAIDEIYETLLNIIDNINLYNNMLNTARKEAYKFLYSNISKLSITINK